MQNERDAASETAIPRAEVLALADEWRQEAELYLESDVESERIMSLQQYWCACKLEEMVEDAE